jgi:hypothetical protein
LSYLYNNFDTTANLYDGMVNDKIAPFFETEGSIKGKFIDYTNANGINAGIIKAQTDCLQNPNSKQCKVGTRTINNRIEQENLQNQGWRR